MLNKHERLSGELKKLVAGFPVEVEKKDAGLAQEEPNTVKKELYDLGRLAAENKGTYDALQPSTTSGREASLIITIDDLRGHIVAL